jgi:hypothetical protein
MLKKLRTARMLLDVALYTRGETRRLNEHLGNLKYGADQGLEVVESLSNAVQGEFGVADSWVLSLTAYNWAPKVDPSLRRKLPWSWRED